MTRIDYSKRAQQDILELRAYISRQLGSPLTAQRFVRELLLKIELLSLAPLIGMRLSELIEELDPLFSDYRRYVIKNHLIFYHFDKGLDIVTIAHVVHEKKSYTQLFS